jgi:hypothetical protein
LCYNFLPFISYITVKRCSCSDLPTGARILILISSAWGEVFSVQLYCTCIVVDADSLFVWLVADGWCWFVVREKYCWLVAGG